MTTPIEISDVPDGPVVTRWLDGHLTYEYPNGRPDWFAITPEAFEAMVVLINERLPDVTS